VPGYVDPVDANARGGLLASGALSSFVIIGEVFSRRPRRGLRIPVRRTEHTQLTMPVHVPTPQTPVRDPNDGSTQQTNTRPSHVLDPMGNALEALKRAEDAVQRTRNDLDKLK